MKRVQFLTALAVFLPLSAFAQTLETSTTNVTLTPGERMSFQHSCQSGTVLGGGFSLGNNRFEVRSNYAVNTTSWRVDVLNDSDVQGSGEVTVHAICSE